MRVFVDTGYDEYGYSLYPVDDERLRGRWIRQHGSVYDIPKRLVRKYEAAKAECERLRHEVGAIVEEQEPGEPSPYRHEDNRSKPKVTTNTFQLRHVKTGAVMTEVNVPIGSAFVWEPQLGAEPDGVCQWWVAHPNDDGTFREDFVKIGGPIHYDRKRVADPLATVYPEDKIGVSS